MDKIARLSRTAIDLVIGAGAFKAGIATTETLLGGPESTDLTYLLPEAKSAVVAPSAAFLEMMTTFTRSAGNEAVILSNLKRIV